MSKILTFPTKPGLNFPIQPTTQRVVTLANGRGGIVQTLAAMRKYVDEYKISPQVRETATRLVKPLDQKDYINEIKVLFNYVKNSIRYTRDVLGVETVQTPEYTLQHRIGDCDDKATLLAALLEAIGFETRFHAMGRSGGGICHVIAEVRNPLTGLWIPLETTMDVQMGWMPPDTDKHIFYHGNGEVIALNGFLSSVTKKVKSAVSGAAKNIKSHAETAINTTKKLSHGDVKGAASTSWAGAKASMSSANQLRKDIHSVAIPKIARDAEGRLTDETVKVLNTKAGSIVLSFLSIIPVTAPFALATQGALIAANAELARKAMSQMDAEQKKITEQVLATARYVYDPAIQAIRERQPTGDDALVEFKYIDGKLTQLSDGEKMNVKAELTPAQKKTIIDNAVAATALQYPEYAEGLKKQLYATGLTGSPVKNSTLGDLGLGWGEAIGQVMTQVAGQYASGKIAAKFADDQVKNQVKLMNAQLAKQPQTAPVQGQRAALAKSLNELDGIMGNKTVLFVGGVAIIGLLALFFVMRKKRRGR